METIERIASAVLKAHLRMEFHTDKHSIKATFPRHQDGSELKLNVDVCTPGLDAYDLKGSEFKELRLEEEYGSNSIYDLENWKGTYDWGIVTGITLITSKGQLECKAVQPPEYKYSIPVEMKLEIDPHD